MPLSTIVHWQQRRDGECLAACAAMVLTALGEQVNYARLRQRLNITDSGAPFSNITRLRSWRITVELAQGQLTTLEARLTAGAPIIVPVATELLPHWLLRIDVSPTERITEHAIVVVGMDDHAVTVHDPDFAAAPLAVDLGWFRDAWQHHDNRYAVIRRRF